MGICYNESFFYHFRIATAVVAIFDQRRRDRVGYSRTEQQASVVCSENTSRVPIQYIFIYLLSRFRNIFHNYVHAVA